MQCRDSVQDASVQRLPRSHRTMLANSATFQNSPRGHSSSPMDDLGRNAELGEEWHRQIEILAQVFRSE